MTIGTFDPHKALTATEYGRQYTAARVSELHSWHFYSSEVELTQQWLELSGVRTVIDKVAKEKGLKIVLCLNRAEPDYEQFAHHQKLVLNPVSIIDSNVFIHIDSSIDITDEVMSLLLANR